MSRPTRYGRPSGPLPRRPNVDEMIQDLLDQRENIESEIDALQAQLQEVNLHLRTLMAGHVPPPPNGPFDCVGGVCVPGVLSK